MGNYNPSRVYRDQEPSTSGLQDKIKRNVQVVQDRLGTQINKLKKNIDISQNLPNIRNVTTKLPDMKMPDVSKIKSKLPKLPQARFPKPPSIPSLTPRLESTARSARNTVIFIIFGAVFLYAVGSAAPSALSKLYLELDERKRKRPE